MYDRGVSCSGTSVVLPEILYMGIIAGPVSYSATWTTTRGRDEISRFYHGSLLNKSIKWSCLLFLFYGGLQQLCHQNCTTLCRIVHYPRYFYPFFITYVVLICTFQKSFTKGLSICYNVPCFASPPLVERLLFLALARPISPSYTSICELLI